MHIPQRLVVFDAITFKNYASGESDLFPDEIDAFRVPIYRRQLAILLTDGILSEYQQEANKPPQIRLLPVVNKLNQDGIVLNKDEYRIRRFPVDIPRFPQWHKTFILDAIGANGEYLVTNRRRWLSMEGQARSRYNLHIVTPAQFVELEG